MSLILRKIRKSKWYKTDIVPWLKEEDIQADAFGDIVTSSNTLSVWLVEDDKSNLDHVITALASTCDNISNFDYALINIDLLIKEGIEIDNIAGKTPYSKANHWHRDLVKLTANKLFKLTEIMFKYSEKNRASEKYVLDLIKNAVTNEYIKKTDLREGITKKLN